MIAYEELVAALAAWRERNGLPVGAADYLGEPPPPEPVSFAAYESRPEHDLQLVAEQSAAEPAAAAADELAPEEAPAFEVALVDEEYPVEDYPAYDEQTAYDEFPGSDATRAADEPVFATDDVAEAAPEASIDDDSYGVAVDAYGDAEHAFTDEIDEAAGGIEVSADDAVIGEQAILEEAPAGELADEAGIATPVEDAPPSEQPEAMDVDVDFGSFQVAEEAGAADSTQIGVAAAPEDEPSEPAPAEGGEEPPERQE